MFWVLTVVLFRSLRGNQEEKPAPVDHETVHYEGVVFFDEQEQLPEIHIKPTSLFNPFSTKSMRPTLLSFVL